MIQTSLNRQVDATGSNVANFRHVLLTEAVLNAESPGFASKAASDRECNQVVAPRASLHRESVEWLQKEVHRLPGIRLSQTRVFPEAGYVAPIDRQESRRRSAEPGAEQRAYPGCRTDTSFAIEKPPRIEVLPEDPGSNRQSQHAA